MRMRRLVAWGVSSGALGLVMATAVGAADPPKVGIYRGVSTAVKFDISPPLRSIPPAAFVAEEEEREEWEDRKTGLEGPLGPQRPDGAVQRTKGEPDSPWPIATFAAFHGQGSTPPDSDGDVGPNHYVVMVNLRFAVYSKTGTLLFGPVANNTLWAGFGGPCQTENAGDPIVLY